MKNEIVVYVEMYKITFKDGTEDKMISLKTYKRIEGAIAEGQFFELDGELFNPWEVRFIKKCSIEDRVIARLNEEPEHIKSEVSSIMKNYEKSLKKKVNLAILENMINKVKGIKIDD